MGGLEDVLWDVLLVDDEAEHVLVEPVVGHDVVALVAALGAPRVLDLPLDGLAGGVEVDGGECHGVGRTTVEG